MWSVNLCKHFRVLNCVAFSHTHAWTQIIIVTLMADSSLSVPTLPAACQAPRVNRGWLPLIPTDGRA